MQKPRTNAFLLAALVLIGAACASTPRPPADDDDTPVDDDDDNSGDDDDTTVDDDDSGDDDDATPPPCVRVDSDGDGSFDDDAVIVPLAPGVYGPEVEHAVFHGTGAPGDLSNGYLYNVGDVGGDGFDDFLLTAEGGAFEEHHDYVFHGPFAARNCPISEAGAAISNVSGGGANYYRGSGLGDLNGDGVPDIRVRGNVYYGPVLGEVTAPDLSLGFAPSSAVAARLNGDDEIDLVTASVGYDDYRGAVFFYAGPISSAADITNPEILVGAEPNDWLGEGMVAVRTEQGRDVVVVSGEHVEDGVYLLDSWPGGGSIAQASFLPISGLEGAWVGGRLTTDNSDRLCAADALTARCGTLEELAQGGGLSIDDNPSVAGSFGSTQVGATPNYTAVAEGALGGYVRVFGPTPEDYWEFTSVPGGSAFGRGLALSENTGGDYVWLIASAPGENASVGAVHIYALRKSPAGR